MEHTEEPNTSVTSLSQSDKRQAKRRKTIRRLFVLASYTWWSHAIKHGIKQPKHDSQLPGYKWMLELWEGNEYRFFEQFRMRKQVMGKLLHVLQTRHGFKQFQNIAVDESLGMFLAIIGHAMTFTNVTERFQHSGQTVSAHFHEMLAAVCSLGNEMISPEDPNFTTVPAKLANDRRYYPGFAGCIGAIDGTHINVRLTWNINTAWYDRHGVPSTTVLAVYDFNLCATYAKIGSEGSMHDSRVLFRALRDRRLPFPAPPEGKYYLADAGFPNMKGFLTPYKKTRYHIPDFRQAGVIRNRNENFNYLHSSLRSMIERTFGVLKARFKILKNMKNFELNTQMRIIWAVMAVHNFIRRNDICDIHLLEQVNRSSQGNENNNTPSCLG